MNVASQFFLLHHCDLLFFINFSLPTKHSLINLNTSFPDFIKFSVLLSLIADQKILNSLKRNFNIQKADKGWY